MTTVRGVMGLAMLAGLAAVILVLTRSPDPATAADPDSATPLAEPGRAIPAQPAPDGARQPAAARRRAGDPATAPPATLRVRVTDPGDAPLLGATVAVAVSPPAARGRRRSPAAGPSTPQRRDASAAVAVGTTGVDGVVELSVPGGQRLTVFTNLRGFAPRRDERVRPREQALTIPLVAMQEVRGTVADAITGGLLNDFKVHLRPLADADRRRNGDGLAVHRVRSRQFTAAGGSFSLGRVPTGEYSLSVRADGFRAIRDLRIAVPSREPLLLALHHSAPLDGVVLTADGRPVQFAVVHIIPQEDIPQDDPPGPRSHIAATPAPIQTDADDGDEMAAEAAIDAGQGDAAGADSAADASHPVRVYTDANGAFHLPRMRPGRYRVTTGRPKAPAAPAVGIEVLAEHGARVELRVPDAAPLAIAVSAADGAPIARARLVLRSKQSGSQGRLRTDDEGRALLPAILPGEWQITALARGFLPRGQTATVALAQALAHLSLDPAPAIAEPEQVRAPRKGAGRRWITKHGAGARRSGGAPRSRDETPPPGPR